MRLVARPSLCPGPGSAAGYRPSSFVEPPLLMLHGGGRTLEDLRQIRGDAGLCEKTNRAFRLVVIRRPVQLNLLTGEGEKAERYALIASNRAELAKDTGPGL